MSNRPRGFGEIKVLRRIAPIPILLAATLFAMSAPSTAQAQVNIDQDKTPAHIYASDCSVCHKSMRGLANGRSRTDLAGFLAEHYTSSDSEAAALAAYVLAGGGGVGIPAPARDAQVGADHARASAEGPKKHDQKRDQAQHDQTHARTRKPSREARRPGAPEGRPADAAAKPQRSSNESSKRGEGSKPAETRKPEEHSALEQRRERRQVRHGPEAAVPRTGPKPAETPVASSGPATAAVAPSPHETPGPASSGPAAPPPAATPRATAHPSKGAPASNDNIPD